MAQFVSDSFTGADGTGLATYNADWVRSTVSGGNGTMGLSGGRVLQSGATGSVYAHATAALQADYDVSANLYIVTASGTPSVGVLGRMAGTGAAALTFYQARIVTGTGIVLARFINSTATTLASVAYTPVQGESPKITLRMAGSQLSVLLNDVQVLTATDANITAAGYVGMRMISANTSQIHIDNFSADTPETGGGAVTGSLNKTFDALTTTASGAVGIAGALTASLAPITITAAGTTSSAVTSNGNLVATLGALQVSAAGTVAIAASLSKTLGALSTTSAGKVNVSANLSKTLGALTITSAGFNGNPPRTATLTATLAPMTAASAGAVAITGALTRTLGSLNVSAAGTAEQLSLKAVLNATLGALTISARAVQLTSRPASPDQVLDVPSDDRHMRVAAESRLFKVQADRNKLTV